MLIVKKFGGTSVANKERIFNVASRCIEEYRKGNDVVVVLSAMGKYTDELITMARDVNEKPPKREMDMLFTIGEQMSVALMAMAMDKLGVPAVSLNAFQVSMHTTSSHGNARLKRIDTERIRRELDSKKIVIVTGFQGVDKYDDYTTLGRGGSDTTAVALAAALHADACEIYTDVDGVYTADLTGIDYDQALEQFATGGSAMFCSGPWDYDAIMEKNPELQLDMMPFYGTKESAGWLIGGPGCGFAANASSKNLDAVKKVLAAISTTDGQNALWQNNQGGSSYLNGVEFDLPEAYTSVAGALAAGNVYCPWNEWGSAAGAHETYGTEMQSYLLGAQDLSTTLQTVDEVVSELLSK